MFTMSSIPELENLVLFANAINLSGSACPSGILNPVSSRTWCP